MKKIVYISAFVFLGILTSFLIHAAVEITIIKLIVSNLDRWGIWLSWGSWLLIHYIGSIVLLLLGIFFGYKQGKHWWRVIYVEKSH